MQAYIFAVEIGDSKKYYFCELQHSDLHFGHTVDLEVEGLADYPAILALHHFRDSKGSRCMCLVSFAAQAPEEQYRIEALLKQTPHFNVGLEINVGHRMPTDWGVYRKNTPDLPKSR